jgi:hypothetical protein
VDRPSDAFSYDIQNSELESVLSKKPRMEAIERHYQIKQDKGETTYVVVFGLLQETDPTKGQPCFFTLLTDRGSKVSFRIPERSGAVKRSQGDR